LRLLDFVLVDLVVEEAVEELGLRVEEVGELGAVAIDVTLKEFVALFEIVQ